MQLESREEGAATVVTVSGKLDAVTAPVFEKSLRELVDGGAERVVVDLAELDYVSSAGLRALLVMGKLLTARGGRSCIANARGNVLSVFEMSGFATLFRLSASLQAALRDIEA